MTTFLLKQDFWTGALEKVKTMHHPYEAALARSHDKQWSSHPTMYHSTVLSQFLNCTSIPGKLAHHKCTKI